MGTTIEKETLGSLINLINDSLGRGLSVESLAKMSDLNVEYMKGILEGSQIPTSGTISRILYALDHEAPIVYLHESD